MYEKLPIVMSSILLCSLLLASCGSEKSADYRSPKLANTLEAISEKPNEVVVRFTLPDRSQDASLKAVTGYYLRLIGEGSNCPPGEMIEEVGTWDDANRVVNLKVNGKCTYGVTMRLGVYQGPALARTGPINYEEHIKPMLELNCISCHETFASYSEVVQNGEMIIQQVEAKTMPQLAPLSDADIAMFLAWKDGAFLETSSVGLPSAKEQLLSSVYYQNNHNDFLMAYEMLSRSTYELRRSLWIQPAGIAAGLLVKEISTYEAQ